MKNIDILFERAERNRMKHIFAMDKIADIAQAKMKWSSEVSCSFNEGTGMYILKISVSNHRNSHIEVDARDFFHRFGCNKYVTEKELLNIISYD